MPQSQTVAGGNLVGLLVMQFEITREGWFGEINE